jgi:hypothetical protein
MFCATANVLPSRGMAGNQLIFHFYLEPQCNDFRDLSLPMRNCLHDSAGQFISSSVSLKLIFKYNSIRRSFMPSELTFL